MTRIGDESRRQFWWCAIPVATAVAVIVGATAWVSRSAPPHYSPASFRADLKSLVAAKRYATATEFLNSADPQTQARFDKIGYIAIGEDAIVLPGVPGQTEFEPNRDWLLPGTSDAITDAEWQQAAIR